MAVALFAYRRGASLMHKAPALAKLLGLFALCAATFAGGACKTAAEALSPVLLARTALCLGAVFAAFCMAGRKAESLKKMRFVLFIGAFVTLFMMCELSRGAGGRWSLRFSPDGFAGGIVYGVRFFITAFAAELVFETTSPLEIKSSLERLQDALALVFPPLKRLNPALVIALAVNFIPDVFETWSRVRLASRARTPRTSRASPVAAVRNLLCELSALLSCLLRRAETKRQAVLNRS